MRIKVMLPTEILVDEPAAKVIAEAENGSFCMLPHHIDFVAALVPGLLTYVTEAGEERFLAVAEGTLVKCGPEVLVSTRNAVQGTDLARLKEAILSRDREADEHEFVARTALARLEAGVIRRFIELEEML
jgi:F-type H+-transporting ATPase subunit epsilon